jgi:hypothetical protein
MCNENTFRFSGSRRLVGVVVIKSVVVVMGVDVKMVVESVSVGLLKGILVVGSVVLSDINVLFDSVDKSVVVR